MNALAAELALRFESAAVNMIPEHLNGILNFDCDALSRLAQGAAVPEVLRQVRRCRLRPLSAQFFWAWPRALLSHPTSPIVCGPGAFGKGRGLCSPGPGESDSETQGQGQEQAARGQARRTPRESATTRKGRCFDYQAFGVDCFFCGSFFFGFGLFFCDLFFHGLAGF